MRPSVPRPLLSILLAAVISLGCEERRDPGTEGVTQPEPPSGDGEAPGEAEGQRDDASPKAPGEEPGATSPSSPRADGPESTPPQRPGAPSPGTPGGAPPSTVSSCDAIYTITTSRRLYAFNPRNNRFTLRGTIDCPDVTEASPFSMAVARTGVAHVLFDDGGIREIDLNDAGCKATSFKRHQLPEFGLFGMSYARNDGSDALFVIAIPKAGKSALAKVTAFPGALERLGKITIDDRPSLIELSGSPEGLWGFLTYEDRSGRLAKLDRKTGSVQRSVTLDVGRHANGLALAWFGGAFYIFTHVSATTVTRYDPASRKSDVVATLGDRVVGAGASTCVPTS